MTTTAVVNRSVFGSLYFRVLVAIVVRAYLTPRCGSLPPPCRLSPQGMRFSPIAETNRKKENGNGQVNRTACNNPPLRAQR